MYFFILQFGWGFFFTSAVYLFVSILGLFSSSLYIYTIPTEQEKTARLNAILKCAH